MRLIGRREESAAVRAFMDAPPLEDTALVVEGKAGIGKSALRRLGIEHAARRGARVLVTRPTGSEVRLSFAGLGAWRSRRAEGSESATAAERGTAVARDAGDRSGARQGCYANDPGGSDPAFGRPLLRW